MTDDLDPLGRVITSLQADLSAAEAERDRLRAVVDRAQRAWAAHTAHDHDDEPDATLDEWMAAWDALRALDVSPAMGTCPDCGNPLRYCDCPDAGSTCIDAVSGCQVLAPVSHAQPNKETP